MHDISEFICACRMEDYGLDEHPAHRQPGVWACHVTRYYDLVLGGGHGG